MLQQTAAAFFRLAQVSAEWAAAAELGVRWRRQTGMHTLTVRTKFTFGDHVRFNSPTQGCSGSGKIFAITIGADGQLDYIIEIEQGQYSDLQGGVLEDEITLLGSAAETGE